MLIDIRSVIEMLRMVWREIRWRSKPVEWEGLNELDEDSG